MTPDEVLEVASAGTDWDVRRRYLASGHKPEAPLSRHAPGVAALRTPPHRWTIWCRSSARPGPHAAAAPRQSGVMGPKDLARLREVSLSMGIMLETTSRRLLGPGMAHDNAPTKTSLYA